MHFGSLVHQHSFQKVRTYAVSIWPKKRLVDYLTSNVVFATILHEHGTSQCFTVTYTEAAGKINHMCSFDDLISPQLFSLFMRLLWAWISAWIKLYPSHHQVIFAMNAHHNQQAYLCIVIVIVVRNDILTLLKYYTSVTDDISMILMLLFMGWCIVSDSSDTCMVILLSVSYVFWHFSSL